MKKTSAKEKQLFMSIVLIKLFVFLFIFFIFGQDNFFWGDSFAYLYSAHDLQQGDGYNDSRRTPLYSALLAFCLWLSSHYGVVILLGLQIVAAAYSAVLVYRIALFFVKNSYALLAAILFAFELLSAIINMLVLAETFLVLFLLLFLWQFLRYYETSVQSNLIFSALALAAAVWTKPVVTYLYLVPVLFLFFSSTKRHIVLFVAMYCASMLPWMFFAYTQFGFFGISAQGDNNACGYMLISVYSTEYHTDPSDMNMSLFPSPIIKAQKICAGTISSIKLALQYPKSFFKTIFLSTVSMLTNEGYGVLFQKSPEESLKAHHNYLTATVFADVHWYAKIKGAVKELQLQELVAVIVGKLFWICTTILAIFGVYKMLGDRDKKWKALFLFAVAVYFISTTVISTGYGVGARLRYPINPILFIFASIGLSGIVAKISVQKGLFFNS